jgi:hypothetical protein
MERQAWMNTGDSMVLMDTLSSDHFECVRQVFDRFRLPIKKPNQ